MVPSAKVHAFFEQGISPGKEDAMPNLTGQSIGRYHILEQLGEGGMATVYKAYDTRLERNVALKVLRTDQFIPAQLKMVLQRFEREAKSLAKLKHPNIVNILDFGEHEGMPYLVMEYLSGGTLKQKLSQKIPWQEAIQTLLPVARGLAYAHQHGIIHRDVKPANILIDENEEPILTDFGIAKLLEGTDGHTLTGSGVGIGTPEYMAPEQGIGANTIDARADIYSLGIVLYEMVTGRKPYIADTPMAVVLKQMTDPLPRPIDFVPNLPKSVEHILLKALAKEPVDRYTDMNTVIEAMENLLTKTEKFEAKVEKTAPRIKRVKKKAVPRINPSPKVVMAMVGVLAVVLIVSFGVPKAMKQFSVASETKAPSTKTLVPIPTFTLTTLPSTSTLEPSPYPTVTQTLVPARTPVPPSWVTDFAEPILAYIADRPPTIEDDFEQPSEAWVLFPHYHNPSPAKEYKYENGTLRVTDWIVRHREFQFDDYVVDVDALFMPRSNSSLIGFQFRENDNCQFVVSKDLEMNANCVKVPGGQAKIADINRAIESASNRIIHLRLIVKGKQFAFYVDGNPMGYIEHDLLTTGAAWLVAHDNGVFDNFKVWNISNLASP